MNDLTRFRRAVAVAAAAIVAATSLVVAGQAAPVAAAGLGAGGEYQPLTPARIYDSRPESPINEAAPGPKSVGPTLPSFSVQVAGLGGVPADVGQVLAVVVNITVVSPTGDGYLQAFANGATPGTSSIVNFRPGNTVPNLAILGLGADGRLAIRLFSPQPSNAHVLVDVFGWFANSTGAAPRGSRLITTSPGRLYDSDNAGGDFGQTQSRRLQVRGATLENGVVVPPEAVGVMLNVTGDNKRAGSVETYASVVPEQPAVSPGTSNLNLAAGQIKANSVIVPIGADGGIWLYNHLGSTRLVVDVVGWLVPRPDESTTGRVIPLATPFRLFDTREPAFGAARLGAGQAEDWGFDAFVNSVRINGAWVGNQSAVIGNLTGASLDRLYPDVPVDITYVTAWSPDASARPNSSVINVPPGSIPTPNMAVLTYSQLRTVRFYNFVGQLHYLFDASAVVLA